MVSIRRYKKGDEDGIVRLSKIVFPNFDFKKTDFLWRHKFDKKNVFVAVDESNNIVSHWAFIEKKLCFSKREYKAGLTMAAMTAPSHQGKGIFTQLANRLLGDVQKDGYDFLFGFPNDISLGIHERAGFVRIKDFHIYSHPVIKNNGSGAVQLAHISNWSYPHDNVIHIKKDSPYLEWRYIEIPSKVYKFFSVFSKKRILGAIVVKKYRRNDGVHLQMVDFLCEEKSPKPGVVFDLLNTLGNIEGADFISTWAQGFNSIEDKMLRKFNFSKDNGKAFHLVAKFISRRSQNLVNSPWDIKMGDTEIF